MHQKRNIYPYNDGRMMKREDNREREFFEVILNWFQENKREFAWRKNKCTAYEVLISEILLRRSMANRVQVVFIKLINRYPNSKELSKAIPNDVMKIISTLGLENRYETLIRAAKYLNQTSNYTFEAIKSIKGIGDYISGAFMIFHKGENIPIIDSNIKRIFTRYFRKTSDDEISTILKQIPRKRIREFYYSLIDLGSLVCKPKPNCIQCPLIRSCSYKTHIERV